jgi:hypothetical protein
MSELEGRGAAWSEERGTSEEGKAAPQGALQASGKTGVSGAPDGRTMNP